MSRKLGRRIGRVVDTLPVVKILGLEAACAIAGRLGCKLRQIICFVKDGGRIVLKIPAGAAKLAAGVAIKATGKTLMELKQSIRQQVTAQLPVPA